MQRKAWQHTPITFLHAGMWPQAPEGPWLGLQPIDGLRPNYSPRASHAHGSLHTFPRTRHVCLLFWVVLGHEGQAALGIILGHGQVLILGGHTEARYL